MKNSIYVIFMLLCYNYHNAQNESTYLDKGVSYNKDLVTNGNITIPLYEVKIEGTSIPINISYNNKGRIVNEVPSSLGFNWELRAGGKVEKRINHLVDESPDGWFFNGDNSNVVSKLYDSGADVAVAKSLLESRDLAPDIYTASISNGDYIQYTYDKRVGANGIYFTPTALRKTKEFPEIYTNFNLLGTNGYGNYDENNYHDDDDKDIYLKSEDGITYLFRKGIKRERPWDFNHKSRTGVDSLNYQDYYLHKVKPVFNTDEIKFEYIETSLNQLVLHSVTTMGQEEGVDPQVPPATNDPIVVLDHYTDVSIQDISRKEIKKIITARETVEFIYGVGEYHNSENSSVHNLSSNLIQQRFNRLDEIIISDHNGNYVSGYKFIYENVTTSPYSYGEQEERLKAILLYGKNHKDYIVYKKFEYFSGMVESAITLAQDVFGYSNGAHGNDPAGDLTPINVHNGLVDRSPSIDHLKKGILQSVINTNGGKVTYDYIENSFGDIYYGGLLVSSVSSYDNDGTLMEKEIFEYDLPEGFGLPIHETTINATNYYSEGFDENIYNNALKSWETYFTKIDPEPSVYYKYHQLSDFPFDLMRNTPTMDSYLSSLGITDFTQLKAGAFYRKVTRKQINVSTNINDNGYVVNYYSPSLNGLYLDSKRDKIEYYDVNDVKVKEDVYTYELQNIKKIEAQEFDNVHLTLNASGSYKPRYWIRDNSIYYIKNVLKSIEMKEFDAGIETASKKSEFNYLNESATNVIDRNYDKVKEVLNYFNGVAYEKTQRKFFSEYTNISANYEALYYVNPSIEENKWVKSNGQWILDNSVVNLYFNDGKIDRKDMIFGNPNTGVNYTEADFVPSYFDSNNNLITLGEDSIDYEYDANGKLLAEKDLKTGLNTIFQRGSDYNNLFVDAVLIQTTDFDLNASVFYKKSFENPEEIDVVKLDNAFSGKYVFQGNNLTVTGLALGIEYQLSYWGYNAGNWQLFTSNFSGSSKTISKPEGIQYIDEIIIRPKDAKIKSLTHDAMIGATSDLNEMGEGTRAKYDIFGRVIYTMDKNGKVINEIKYNNLTIDVNN